MVGTGDLSELALGWATYNGDHMSMYGVNAGVPKTLVRHLVRYEADIAATDALRTVLLDILDTPVSPELLPAKDNGEIAQSGKFTVRDLTIDYDKHHVLMRGEDVHLTLNEFKIVALLGKYAGKVLTYDFLIREIWGPKAKADNQILRVNMANIRRKIEKNPAAPEYILSLIHI